MTRPLLAICIPTYNRAEPLGRLLDRLHDELGDATDVVVLVSDNASPDGTRELLTATADRMPSLRIHRQPENLGALGNTRWLVANAPDCEYLWIFGDDDEPEPGSITYACGLLRAHSPAWLHLPHRFVHPDGSVRTESRLPLTPEVYADPGRMYLAQTHWLTFLSASIVRRDDLHRIAAVSSTETSPLRLRTCPATWLQTAPKEISQSMSVPTKSTWRSGKIQAKPRAMLKRKKPRPASPSALMRTPTFGRRATSRTG